MKKILIPTDFSSNAKKAIDYALLLFDGENTEIVLLNTFYVPYADPDVAFSINNVIYDNSQKLFKEEQKRIKAKFPNLKSFISFRFQIGDVVSVVDSIEDNETFDLIVMGTKGASGRPGVLIGSRTSLMVKTAKAPLLAVPEDTELIAPKRILFTADEKLIDRNVNFDILKEIANRNYSNIDVLHISNNNENKRFIEAFIDYELHLNFVDIPHELSVEEGKNVKEAILKYTEEHPIDLMAMISTKGSMFYNLFHRSISKRVTLHTKIPLLILHLNLKN